MKFPMHFRVIASSEAGVQKNWEGGAENFPPIPCAIPKEFNGPGGAYSPEELFALALLTCLMATFKVYSEKASFSYQKIEGYADLIIDKSQKGPIGITHVDIHVKVSGAGDKEKAEKLLGEAKQGCLVSNATKATIGFTFEAS